MDKKRSDMIMEELEKSLIKCINKESEKTKCINPYVLKNRIKTYNMNRETLKILVTICQKNGAFKAPGLELVEMKNK